jgi:hypothetical protein
VPYPVKKDAAEQALMAFLTNAARMLQKERINKSDEHEMQKW